MRRPEEMGRVEVSVPTIQLTKGKTTIVDACNFDELNAFEWYAIRPAGQIWLRRKRRLVG
jgi:hypothetical protein